MSCIYHKICVYIWHRNIYISTETYIYLYYVCCIWKEKASLLAQQVKNLPAIQETQEMQVQSLGWEDPPEKEMATLSSTLVWETPWREEPGGLQSKGSPTVGHNWATQQSTCRQRGKLDWSNVLRIYLNNIVFKISATLNLSLFINDKYTVLRQYHLFSSK